MDPALRLSSEEREAAVERLRGHYLAGRLQSDEFETRVDEAHRARDGSELQALFRDLPDPVRRPPTRHPRGRTLRYLLLRYLLGALFVMAIWAATGRHGSFWPIWPIIVGGFVTGRQVLAVTHGAELRGRDRRRLPPPPG